MDKPDSITQDQLTNLTVQDVRTERRISRKQLVNLFNYINFQDGTITVNFKHRRFGNLLSVEMMPQPCLDDILECIWIDPKPSIERLSAYNFHDIVIPDGLGAISINGELLRMTAQQVSIRLPDQAMATSSCEIRQQICKDVTCELMQNGAILNGRLRDYTPILFGLEVEAIPPQSFLWINNAFPVHLVMRSGGSVVFSGDCSIMRSNKGTTLRRFWVRPLRQHVSRYKTKIVRSKRYRFTPSPHVWFKHPLTQKTVHLVIDEISGSGFSVREYFDRATLCAGLMIPELSIEITSGITITCRAQVIYNTAEVIDDNRAIQKCGVAFLDMGLMDQIKLANLLHQRHDDRATVCATVDMDDLWRFFFEAGFIYPKKYSAISEKRETFKETYERLYLRHPEIARHFLYLDKGQIQGHISMLHVYETTWIFHHHASDRTASKRAGLVVLYQIGHYVNDFYNLSSTQLHYIISYFRPENRFPLRMFGGVRDSIKNPKGCSIDPFLFLHYCKGGYAGNRLDAFGDMQATLTPADSADIRELNFYYEQRWGGLTLTALDLLPERIEACSLKSKFAAAGFVWDRLVFALRREGELVAAFMLTVTDFGLNLSNLTNCIHVFVLNDEGLPANLFYATLERLADYFPMDEIPVLILGPEFAKHQKIPYEKQYNCWVLNVPDAVDQYYQFTDNFLLRG